MGITESNQGLGAQRHHRGSNDALRALVVLSNLLSLNATRIRGAFKTQFFFDTECRRKQYPFVARIMTEGHKILLTHIKAPWHLAKLFAAYNPISAAVKAGHKDPMWNGVRKWWVYLPTLASLDKLVVDFDGSVLNGKRLESGKICGWLGTRRTERAPIGTL
jgi:hypothetical protein